MTVPPLPAGPYSCILADPPWQFVMRSAKGMDRCPDGPPSRAWQRSAAPVKHYRTMPTAEIKAIPVGDVAGRDCVLFLWAIDAMLPDALEVGRAWGFKHVTTALTWVKCRKAGWARAGEDLTENQAWPMGPGYWARANPEICLLFKRGRPPRRSVSVPQLLFAPRREHSRKPDEQYARLEALCDGPRLEMFARTTRPGWTAWGNQVDRFDQEAA